MKIQHWAIIFIIIILPFSIICRNAISKKTLLLKDETKYNNVIDNATYDAVSQILEVSEELGYGKNIPITQGVADAAIDRFFNTLCVNFNLPIGRENAESYFSQYIPAIIIVGYDGLYVYSYEPTASGYDFVLKPKIPYAYDYSENITINFTLDNYVKMYFKGESFLSGVPDETGNIDNDGTHILEGYIGEKLEREEDNPFGIPETNTVEYIKNTLPMFTDNLSYILKVWAAEGSAVSPNTANGLELFYKEGAAQDYEYYDDGTVKTYASDFNLIRRETIINLITAVLKEEFNEHNVYADYMGVTYEFNIPDIGRDQWNNTIDDISVLAFMQGMPMGSDMYYNNYSLGGARIVKANYLYGVQISEESNGRNPHKVYHKYYCPLLPKDETTGEIRYDSTYEQLDDGSGYYTSGVDNIFINADHANEAGYYICSQCM